MADDVKWIKLKVGMFDGESFKKIKRAKIGGESFRDKLTAIWFELMDFAGRCNRNGAFIDSREIPYHSFSDIATMIDRDEKEVELCMQFYINEGMIEVIDDVYMLSNWDRYQSVTGLSEIREKKRISQAKWREKKRLELMGASSINGVVDSTVDSTKEQRVDSTVDSFPLYSFSDSLSTSTSLNQDSTSSNDIGKTSKKKSKAKKNADGEAMYDLYCNLADDYDFSLSERMLSRVSEWMRYKVELGEPYKEQGMKSLMRQIDNNIKEYGETAVYDLIDKCMARQWKGIIWDDLKKPPRSATEYGRAGFQDTERPPYKKLT